VKYVPPARLYIIASFLFFFVLNVFSPKGAGAVNNPVGEKNGGAINFTVSGVSTAELAALSAAQADSLMKAKGIDESFFYKYPVTQLYKIANGGMGSLFIRSLKTSPT